MKRKPVIVKGSAFTWNGEIYKYVRKQGAYTVCLRKNGCLTSIMLPKDFFNERKQVTKRGS